MISLTRSQFKRITISFAIVALLIQAISYTLPFEVVLHYKWLTFAVLYFTTLISTGFQNMQWGDDTKRSAVQMVILSTIAKIILYSIYAAAIIYLSEFQVKNDLIFFAALYMFITISDIAKAYQNR